MAVANGTFLLRPDGSKAMDANGNRVVSDGTKDGLCCWKYPRVCGTDVAAGFGMTKAVANTLAGGFFKVTGDDTCYYFGDDPMTCIKPATVKGLADIAAEFPDCATCQIVAVPCDDTGCLRVQEFEEDGTFIQEIFYTKTEGCSYSAGDIGLGYDASIGKWSVGTDVVFETFGITWGDPSTIPLGVWAEDGAGTPPTHGAGRYIIVSEC